MSHIFSAKNFSIFAYHSDVNFNKSLTNGIISFEQLGPGLETICLKCQILAVYWFSGGGGGGKNQFVIFQKFLPRMLSVKEEIATQGD